MNPRHRAQIERLEAQAARHPRLYRFRLAVIAIGGDFLLTAAHIAPWVLPIGLGVFVLNNPVGYALGGAVLVFFVYLSRPALRLKGRELSRAEAPVLFAEIDAIRDRLQVRQRMEVMLDDSFNAGALETRGLFGLVGTRRVLFLGVPLLAALPQQEVLAVIAHEFGHFSRRHGRLGHWLYRARVGWIELAEEAADSDIVLDKSTAWIARRLIPYFSRISFVHARHCEYEADADAAAASGSRVFGDALTRVAVLARVWSEGFPRNLAMLRRDQKQAPDDLHERFAQAAASWPAPELESWRAEALREKSDWLDTHPRLTERLAVLKETCEPVVPAPGAGAQLLGASWPGILAEFNARWRETAEWEWAFEHLRFRHLLARLLMADDATAATWPLPVRLSRARALRATAPAQGLTDLRRLHEQFPQEASVEFAYGAALLNEDDAAGVAILEALAVRQPTFRVPVYRRLIVYFSRSDGDESERWTERLEGAAMRRATAMAPFLNKAERGRARPSALPPEAIAVLAEALALDPCVERGWLFQGREPLGTAQSEHAADLDIHGLVLTLDPAVLSRTGADEGSENARYSDALEALVAADAAVAVTTYYSTQPIPEDLDRCPPLFDRRATAAG